MKKISKVQSDCALLHYINTNKHDLKNDTLNGVIIEKSAINIKNHSVLYKNSTIYSKPLAKLESGRLLLINKCDLKWCKITSGNFKGWIDKNYLWGNVK